MKIRFSPTVASFLGALVIRVLGATWRIEWRRVERVAEARRMSHQVIYAFWHGRLLAFSYSHRNRGVQVLASEHADGDLMGRTIRRLGFGHRKGSTTRGGASALRDLSSLLREGLDVALTIDGPRGPRGRVQQGAIELGRMTASAIVPITNSARPRVLFRSWDRFQLPLPFARVIIDHGEPFLVPAGTGRDERERYRVGLERGLAGLTSALDAELGYDTEEVWPHEDH